MADQPYRDPKTTKIEDWKWRPLEQVKAKLDINEVPDYIQKGFGSFMNEQAGRSQRGEMSPRDLIKAYTIAQSSIGRGGLSHGTATKTGMRLPNTGGEVRPEGAFAEWLGSSAGQKYLDMAERGTADMTAIGDLQGKFAPFGKHNDQAEKMVLAAKMAQLMGPGLNQALTGSADEYRDYAEKMKGIAGAKSGFIGSLLGRGDLPTLDARQLALHALPASVGIGSIMNRGKGKGAREAVDRLSARQRAMGLSLDPSLDPHYQHLAHHAVWDKASGTETTHDDLMRAMRGYAQGGNVEPTPDQMREMLAQSGHLTSTPKKPHAAVGQRYGVSEPTGLAPKTPVDLEKHKGASLMVMPWDSTSRNVQVHSISGHELPESVTTHGGQDYARDLEHILQGIAGASGEDIAKRIATREAIARMENEKQGGTGQLLHMPITMGERGEDFSMTPTEILHQLVMRGMLHPDELARMNNEIRTHKILKNKKYIRPFGGFVGLEHPEFDEQIVTGKGLGTTAGELRKAIVNRVGYLKNNQKALDFNMEDLVNAVTDPALRGVPKGYVGNTVIGSDPDHMTLTPSSNKAYDTNFSGQYLGTLGHSMPVETLFGNKMADLHKEFAGKQGDIRNMTLGALEKRNEGISQMLNNETLDKYGKYLMARENKLRTGHYAEGGAVEGGEVKAEPSHDEMLAHIMLHGMSSLKDVGANEAPNMKVKTYAPPSGGPGFPVGGVDFQPEAKGQQMLPGQPGQPPGAPGQPPQAGGPQGGPPPGAPGQPPAPAPGGPQSNILQMTPQGQAMAAMRPGMPMPKMAGGGSTTPSVEEMRRAIASAATSAGMKAPVTNTRNMMTLQDSYQSLGDDVRKKAADMQDMMESMPFKYDVGHTVFTAHSAKNNLPPFKVIRKALVGNSPMREDSKIGPGMGKPIKDPMTGKTKRTPYEPGYDVRREHKGEVHEMRIPESAILDKLAAGGTVKDYITISERPL